MATELYLKGSESGAKAQFAEIFAEDIVTGSRPGKALDLIVEVSTIAGVAPDIDITFDSGATWVPFLPAVKIDTIVRQVTGGADTDLINFRISSVAGANFGRFTVIGDIDA